MAENEATIRNLLDIQNIFNSGGGFGFYMGKSLDAMIEDGVKEIQKEREAEFNRVFNEEGYLPE